MSFFKELKEDIVQSVNELSDTLEEKVSASEEAAEEAETLETEVQKEIDSILEDGILNDMSVAEEDSEDVSEPEEPSEPDLSAEVQEEKEETEEMAADIPELEEELQEEEPKEEEPQEEPQEDSYFGEVDRQEENKIMNMSQEEDNMSDFEETVEDNSEETTVITKGTTINGGIKSDTSLIVKGVIEGDVECQGKLTITGHVAGNSTASEIYVNTPRLEGSLNSHGSVKIDVSTVVIGSITSASVVVAGAVKGDIDVNGPVIIDSTAVVKGSVFAKSIQINSGAVIDGNCSLKYADVDLDTFFD